MAHYAFLDENNTVVEVIVGRDEDDLPDGISSWEDYYGEFRGLRCLRTSYNTMNNVHNFGGIPFRGNYAGIGYLYIDEHDIFVPPKPFNSWLLDLDIADWKAPVPYPTDGQKYQWNEDELAWELLVFN